MVRRPSFGGDTCWTHVGAAYDRLSNGMKQLLERRRAMHEIAPGVSAIHPVVREHPDTGRKVIYVNEIFVRGIQNLPDGEGEAILGFLLQHVQSPDFQYRHVWDDGDIVAWDNHLTQHYAASDYTERRVVHRVGFTGSPFPDRLRPESRARRCSTDPAIPTSPTPATPWPTAAATSRTTSPGGGPKVPRRCSAPTTSSTPGSALVTSAASSRVPMPTGGG